MNDSNSDSVGKWGSNTNRYLIMKPSWVGDISTVEGLGLGIDMSESVVKKIEVEFYNPI